MDFCRMCTRVFDRKDMNTMKFDDFIQCCVMLKSLTESFKRLDTNKSGVITINYETVLYNVIKTSVSSCVSLFFPLQFLEMAIDNTIQ